MEMSSSNHPCSGATVDGRHPKQPPGMVQKAYEYWDILYRSYINWWTPDFFHWEYVRFRDGISRHVFFHWQHPSPNWTWPPWLTWLTPWAPDICIKISRWKSFVSASPQRTKAQGRVFCSCIEWLGTCPIPSLKRTVYWSLHDPDMNGWFCMINLGKYTPHGSYRFVNFFNTCYDCCDHDANHDLWLKHSARTTCKSDVQLTT